jgi:superfamily II DNA/RNA helicase
LEEEGGAASEPKAEFSSSDGPFCIILQPARDLAEQTFKVVEHFTSYVVEPTVSCALLIGGLSGREAKEASIASATCDILVASPGVLMAQLKERKISLSRIRLLILDEADRFTEDDNLSLIRSLHGQIKAAIGPRQCCQVGFFSATLHSKEITDLSTDLCVHPSWVDLKGKDSIPEFVHHVVIQVDPTRFPSVWTRKLKIPAGKLQLGADAAGGAGAAQPAEAKRARSELHSRDKKRQKGGAGADNTINNDEEEDDGAADPNDKSSLGRALYLQKQALQASPTGDSMDLPVYTDGVHLCDPIDLSSMSREALSEGLKRLKLTLLVSLIEALKPEQAMIFCRTNVDCDNLEAFLTHYGGGQVFRGGMERGRGNPFSSVVLASGRQQTERRRNLDAFRSGEARFLICTDVAARGLDVKELPFIFNMNLPDLTENYVHRVGRVGRAGKMGLAISFVNMFDEKMWYHTCGKKRCNNVKPLPFGYEKQQHQQGSNSNNNNSSNKSLGCCIWTTDEDKIMDIQQRLQPGGGPLVPIPHMQLDVQAEGAKTPFLLSLPVEILAQGAVYGSERGEKEDAFAASTRKHVASLKSHVAALQSMESFAEMNFHTLRTAFK